MPKSNKDKKSDDSKKKNSSQNTGAEPNPLTTPDKKRVHPSFLGAKSFFQEKIKKAKEEITRKITNEVTKKAGRTVTRAENSIFNRVVFIGGLDLMLKKQLLPPKTAEDPSLSPSTATANVSAAPTSELPPLPPRPVLSTVSMQTKEATIDAFLAAPTSEPPPLPPRPEPDGINKQNRELLLSQSLLNKIAVGGEEGNKYLALKKKKQSEEMMRDNATTHFSSMPKAVDTLQNPSANPDSQLDNTTVTLNTSEVKRTLIVEPEETKTNSFETVQTAVISRNESHSPKTHVASDFSFFAGDNSPPAPPPPLPIAKSKQPSFSQ